MKGLRSQLECLRLRFSVGEERGLSRSKTAKPIFFRESTLVILAFAALICTVSLSGQKLQSQIQRQTKFLEDELVTETHEFNQLQRETLRLNKFIASSEQTLDPERLQFHTDLVQSRITIVRKGITRHKGQIVALDDTNITDIKSTLDDWLIIKQQISELQASTKNVILRQSILFKLAAFEKELNHLSHLNNRKHWIVYESLIENQKNALRFLLSLITSFFLLAALFSLYVLKFIKVRQQLLEEVAQASMTDDLTQIANRRYFNQVLLKEWNRMMRSQQQIALILCDVDYFKRYNDFYGHQAGDDCLHKIAQVLSQVVHRAGDCVARYGGEEFALILPNTSPEAVHRFSLLLHDQVAQIALEHQDSLVSPYVTMSVGITIGIPTPELSPQKALKYADEALYEAKGKGRNTSCLRIFNLKKFPEWPRESLKT